MATSTEESARDKERKQWQDSDAILKEIGLKPGDTFVDIGCGQGFFTIPAAKIVGGTGKVHALDISPFVIETLRERVTQAGFANVDARIGLAERTVLCEACADFVFFGIVMHDFANPKAVLRNARRMLKDSGKLVDLDFKKISMPFGPPLDVKISEGEAKELIESEGLKVKRLRIIEPYSYLLVASLK